MMNFFLNYYFFLSNVPLVLCYCSSTLVFVKYVLYDSVVLKNLIWCFIAMAVVK